MFIPGSRVSLQVQLLAQIIFVCSFRKRKSERIERFFSQNPNLEQCWLLLTVAKMRRSKRKTNIRSKPFIFFGFPGGTGPQNPLTLIGLTKSDPAKCRHISMLNTTSKSESCAKGHLISKCLFGVFNSSTKRTKKIRLEVPQQ